MLAPATSLPPQHASSLVTLFCAVAASAALGLAGCGRSASDDGSPRASTKDAAGSVFAEVTDAARIDFVHQLANGRLDNIMKSDGAGGAVLDCDGDGWMDFYLVNSGPVPVLSEAPPGTPRLPNRLYRNRGDGTFEDIARRAGVEGHGFGTTAAAADIDNDGDTDLLVVNFGGLILFRNDSTPGAPRFTDITAAAGLVSTQAGISATFLDADRDGWLDLFVANYLVFDPAIEAPPGANVPYPGPLSYEPELNLLYRNRGDGTFEDVSERAGIRIPGHRGMSVTPLDYDDDGDQDLYVSNDGTANLLLANDGTGRFADVALESGVAFDQFGQAAGSMGAAVSDASGDGLPDVFVTRFGNASLYVNSGGRFFEDRVVASGILGVSSKFTGWGGNFLDHDNDGDPDLFIANGDPHYLKGMPSLLLENTGRAGFADISARGGTFFQKSVNLRGSGTVDYDNDGRMDLVLTSLGGPAALLRNVTTGTAHWTTIKLVGTRGNRDGFGAKVTVTAGGRIQRAEARCPTSYVFQSDPRLHFGLGTVSSIDRVEIRWPSGQLQVLENPEINQVLRIVEP